MSIFDLEWIAFSSYIKKEKKKRKAALSKEEEKPQGKTLCVAEVPKFISENTQSCTLFRVPVL